jgi:hypothetical protein
VGRYEDSLYLPAYEDGRECSNMLTYKIHTLGNYPEESTEHSEHGESLKSRMFSHVPMVSSQKIDSGFTASA